MSRLRATLAPRIDHWVQDGVFQLQRRAFEAQDQGSWTRTEQEVPVTAQYELLHKLPVKSSLFLRLTDDISTAGKLQKTGMTVTEETVVEVDDEESKAEGKVDRHDARTNHETV